MKMGSEMPFMRTHIDEKTGRVIIDETNVDLIAQRAPDWTQQKARTFLGGFGFYNNSVF